MNERVFTERAPKPIGPYSQAVRADDFLFISGQLGLDPATMKLKSDSVEEQTRQALANVRAILEAAGLSASDLVKVTGMLADIDDFPAFNKAYVEFFTGFAPARATFAVAGLPMNAMVEIEAVAYSARK